MNWNEIKIYTSTEAVEALNYILMEAGIRGMEIIDPKDITMQDPSEKNWDYMEEAMVPQGNLDEVIIKCYVSMSEEVGPYIQLIKEKIKEVAEYLPVGKGLIEVNDVKESDWADNWKKYYKTFKLGERIVIKPTWENYDMKSDDEIVIEMDPGMAFGTGTHETTSMCIGLIEKYLGDHDQVLDVGCGSGILSIVATKLGAQKAIGVDIDANAVRVAKENVEQNHVPVEIRKGNLLDVVTEKADMVVANIMADVIIILSQDVEKCLKEDGVLIVSGIIDDRKEDVKLALIEAGFDVIDIVEKGEWVAIALKKRV